MARISGEYRSVRLGDGFLALAATAIILALLVIWPGSLLDKADHAAFAVCHRIAERSFVIDGRPLPLCARCSGTFLGALAGMIVLALRGRARAACLPKRRYLAVLAVFFLVWGADGLNSYLTLFPILPHLYEPHNLLRLVTGTLQGLAMGALLLPVLNLSLWQAPADRPSIASWSDLAWLLLGGTLVVAAVSSEWPPLLYPLALLSGLTVLLLIGAVNGMLVLNVLRRDGQGRGWQDVAAPLLAGLALGVAELTAIGIARTALTQRFGLPF